jgi:hypothetical protein
MAATRVIVLIAIGLAISGCNQPVPEYKLVTIPPAYRTAPDGLRIDNENYVLDAEGYRLNQRGERIGMVDVPAKTANEKSNAVAGYYSSGTGAAAPGKVAAPSEGVSTGGGGPGAMSTTPAGGPPTPLTPAPAPR